MKSFALFLIGFICIVSTVNLKVAHAQEDNLPPWRVIGPDEPIEPVRSYFYFSMIYIWYYRANTFESI